MDPNPPLEEDLRSDATPGSEPALSLRCARNRQIEALLRAGMRTTDIARELHITPSLVSLLRRQRGLLPVAKRRRAQAHLLFRLGVTTTRIANILGVSRRTASNLRPADLSAVVPADWQTEVAVRLCDGLAVAQIAADLQVPGDAVAALQEQLQLLGPITRKIAPPPSPEPPPALPPLPRAPPRSARWQHRLAYADALLQHSAAARRGALRLGPRRR